MFRRIAVIQKPNSLKLAQVICRPLKRHLETPRKKADAHVHVRYFVLVGHNLNIDYVVVKNKPDFIKQLCTHKKEFREVLSHPEYITDENLDLIEGDVVIIVIAGGNTIPTAAKIIKHAHERGAKTIGTAGIFGYGNENIEIKDISEYDDTNPAIEELRKQRITENHLVLTTNKLIRDNEPVTPYTLDEVAKIITMNALKLLDDRI